MRTEVEVKLDWASQYFLQRNKLFKLPDNIEPSMHRPKNPEPVKQKGKWRSDKIYYLTVSYPVPESSIPPKRGQEKKQKHCYLDEFRKPHHPVQARLSLKRMHPFMERRKEWKFRETSRGWLLGFEVVKVQERKCWIMILALRFKQIFWKGWKMIFTYEGHKCVCVREREWQWGLQVRELQRVFRATVKWKNERGDGEKKKWGKFMVWKWKL